MRMPKHKLSIVSEGEPKIRRIFDAIRAWANTIEDKIEVKAIDTPDIMYIGVDLTNDHLNIYKRTGDTDTLYATINITKV